MCSPPPLTLNHQLAYQQLIFGPNDAAENRSYAIISRQWQITCRLQRSVVYDKLLKTVNAPENCIIHIPAGSRSGSFVRLKYLHCKETHRHTIAHSKGRVSWYYKTEIKHHLF